MSQKSPVECSNTKREWGKTRENRLVEEEVMQEKERRGPEQERAMTQQRETLGSFMTMHPYIIANKLDQPHPTHAR